MLSTNPKSKNVVIHDFLPVKGLGFGSFSSNLLSEKIFPP